MTTELEELPTDPVAMARLYVTGRAMKRADSMYMVKGLLAALDARPVSVPMPTPTTEPVVIVKAPPVEVKVVTKPPIKVHVTDTKSVFLGPEANRHYTKSEALALAEAIANAATGGGK